MRNKRRPYFDNGDPVAAVETVAVGTVLDSAERRVDLVQRFCFHLDQRELNLFLDVDLGDLALVEHVVLLGIVAPRVAHLALNFAQQLATAGLQDEWGASTAPSAFSHWIDEFVPHWKELRRSERT